MLCPLAGYERPRGWSLLLFQRTQYVKCSLDWATWRCQLHWVRLRPQKCQRNVLSSKKTTNRERKNNVKQIPVFIFPSKTGEDRKAFGLFEKRSSFFLTRISTEAISSKDYFEQRCSKESPPFCFTVTQKERLNAKVVSTFGRFKMSSLCGFSAMMRWFTEGEKRQYT